MPLPAKDFLPIMKGPIEKLLSVVGDEYEQFANNRLLEYQCEEYRRCLYSKTLLFRTEPKKLDEFYQPLYIEKYKSPGKTNGLERFSTENIGEFLNYSNKITLIGNAGSGKSTLVKYLVTKCIDENLKIPIRVELRYLNSYSKDIVTYIKEEIFQFHKLGISDKKTDKLLENDSFVFFFDGYDELSTSKRSDVGNGIDNFTKRYPNNNYVVTSRPYAEIELLPLFTNYNVASLSDEEIDSFIKKQIPSDESELVEKIVRAVKLPENLGYRSFLSNPLLLSMFILTFQSYSEIPKNRTDFYQQVFDTLFSIHDSVSKLGYVREKQSGLSKHQFESVLSLFSFVSFFKDNFVFSKKYLNDTLDFVKKKLVNVSYENDKIIDDLQVAIGIINKEGTDYVFPHRSLQEYFSAVYVEQLGKDYKIQIYTKIQSDFIADMRMIFPRSHFITLLAEIDPLNIIRYFVLPVIRYAVNGVKNTRKNTEKIYYVNIAMIVMSWGVRQQGVIQNIRPEFSKILDSSGMPIFFMNLEEANNSKQRRFPKEIQEYAADNIFITFDKAATAFKKDGQSLIVELERYLATIDSNESDVVSTLLQ